MMEARTEPDAESANVVGEIRGRERPDEIVLLGGHLDSWDVGTGASDDGVGCIVTWEALRLMKKLGIRPRRTVRLVLWTNEENGLRGRHRLRGEARGARRQSRVRARVGLGRVRAGERLDFHGSAAARESRIARSARC